MKLRCSTCKELKDENEFSRTKSNNRGRSYECKKCSNTRSHDYYNKNRKLVIEKTADNRHKKENICRYKAYHTLSLHRRYGYTINVSTEYVTSLYEQTTHCPICGCELLKTFDRKNPHTSSLDVKDATKILSEDNIWIVCKRCNVSKQDRTMEEFYEYCRHILNRCTEV